MKINANNGNMICIFGIYPELSTQSRFCIIGFYCGEIDTPKTFISETPYVKVVFHSDSYQIDSYIQFDANVEQQNSVNSRYGQFHQLYPHRRGVAVTGTYCEKTYPDCSPGPRCTLQSPGQ